MYVRGWMAEWTDGWRDACVIDAVVTRHAVGAFGRYQPNLSSSNQPRPLPSHNRSPALYSTWKFRPAHGRRPPNHRTGGSQKQGGKEEKEEEKEKEIKHCIDYIFLADPARLLRPTHRLSVPTAAEVGPDGLPCVAYPSDHLALGVRFAVGDGR